MLEGEPLASSPDGKRTPAKREADEPSVHAFQPQGLERASNFGVAALYVMYPTIVLALLRLIRCRRLDGGSHVYLVGLPPSAEAYTHAAGRCGRNGAPGLVTVLAGEKEEFALARLANALAIEFHDARSVN